MRKLFIAIFVLALIFVGCTTPPTQEVDVTTQTTAEEIHNADVVQTDIEGIFHLRQSPEDFLNVLETEGMHVNETKLTPEDRITEWDGFFSFSSEEIRAHFNPQEQTIALTVMTPRYVTNLGIRVGDSKEKVLELYGNNFTNDFEGFWYYYTYDDLMIGFLFDFDVVAQWVILIPSDQPSRP